MAEATGEQQKGGQQKGGVSDFLLEILVCPETKTKVSPAPETQVAALNSQITRGEVRNRAGKPVTSPVDGLLVREDGTIGYPIRDTIPVMLVDEGIPLPTP